MDKYRKKPVVIEAVRVPDGPVESAERAMEWGKLVVWLGEGDWEVSEGLGISIRTLEGVMLAQPGDWIIRGVKGELYPCKPDIFAATYEPAEVPR